MKSIETFALITEWVESLTDEERALYFPIISILAENDNDRHAWFQIILGMTGARFLQKAVELALRLSNQTARK